LQHLETMGLAAEGEPGQWAVAEGAQAKLRELGARGDIIRTIGQALKDRGKTGRSTAMRFSAHAAEKPIVGRLIDKGLHDELTGTAYAVIDGTDGRTHHVRFARHRGAGAQPGDRRHRRAARGRQARRAEADPDPGHAIGPRPAAQVKAPGATWLDHR
jgi:type IV secretory pathway VirD2 relaxase